MVEFRHITSEINMNFITIFANIVIIEIDWMRWGRYLCPSSSTDITIFILRLHCIFVSNSLFLVISSPNLFIIFLIKTVTSLLLSLLSIPGGRRWTKTGCDSSKPSAAYPPGARHALLSGPPPPADWTDNLLARQYRQPGPVSGLAFGKPSRRSIFLTMYLCWTYQTSHFLFVHKELIFTVYALSQWRMKTFWLILMGMIC